MNNTYERQKDILKLISQLDISVTMYKNADEKYHAVAKFLEDCGIDADIYPQGSFDLTTFQGFNLPQFIPITRHPGLQN